MDEHEMTKIADWLGNEDVRARTQGCTLRWGVVHEIIQKSLPYEDVSVPIVF